MQDGFVDWSKVDPESIELPAEEIARVGLDQPVEVELDDVKEESGFASVIVVDNLPQIPEAKFAKLLNVLTKIFSQIGEVREGGLLIRKTRRRRRRSGTRLSSLRRNSKRRVRWNKRMGTSSISRTSSRCASLTTLKSTKRCQMNTARRRPKRSRDGKTRKPG